MENNILETKNLIIEDLGEFMYEGTDYCCNEYMVHVKDMECLNILFEFEGDKVVGIMPWEQDNKTPEGKKLIDYTYNIAKLIENDVADIVQFMARHL